MYSVYVEYLKRMRSDKPIVCAVPVNLRPFFDSMTTRNFFVMVSAVFKPEKDEYSFEEIADIVKKDLRGQITKEHLEDLFSYNVSNQKNILLRSIPFFIKKDNNEACISFVSKGKYFNRDKYWKYKNR